jgi:hypothetical protein
MMSVKGFFPWHESNVLDEDADGTVDPMDLIRANRGAGRNAPHRNNDYRRRDVEDGYEELDFA